MTMTPAQDRALRHLRIAYSGPERSDEIVFNRPDLQYSVGMLFPVTTPGSETASEEKPAAAHGDDGLPAVVEGDVDEDAAAVPLAEDWRPSSAAISFVTDRRAVYAELVCATYQRITGEGPPRWQRVPFHHPPLRLSDDWPTTLVQAGGLPLEVGARWRLYGQHRLVTVHARLLSESTGDDHADVERTLFQVDLTVTPCEGGRLLEYDRAVSLDADAESPELRLRYRHKKAYAVGHGMAAGWDVIDGVCTRVFLDPVPSFVVPAVQTRDLEAGSHATEALSLAHLSRIDEHPDVVMTTLNAFVSGFADWVRDQEGRAETFGDDLETARRITERARLAQRRMATGVALLRDDASGEVQRAFALAMTAMRLQMRQTSINRGVPADHVEEPQWRPFQLGFLLVALASTVDDTHHDREVVDLIWFPTGGGKTEAYLALAAIEIFKRRLLHGTSGAGTAVITRYTLRLLTAQQFQRAASLVCAMELLRLHDKRAHGLAPFSIGLWIGNDATPGTRSGAIDDLERLHKAARPEEANRFQIEGCPWCSEPLLPEERSFDRTSYGFRVAGRDVMIHCTRDSCPFSKGLPVAVVDEALYEAPPTILLATVDKFARLQFKPEAGRLLGLGTLFRQPSMIIQDELHLLSGPLGTTVAVFDAVVQQLLSREGTAPKIVASTATIRSSREQVEGLYGRPVALYPPAGLDDDHTYFSRPIEDGSGRLYVGLMPQALPQATAVVAAAAPLLELPAVLTRTTGSTRDSYWTAVMYHNSLRELGRTGTLVVDDVNRRLEVRAERLELNLRRVRGDAIVELTSRRGPEQLPKDLRALGRSADLYRDAVDVVLSSNMLSVGVDIPRLALMLLIGQPKTTAEYIQASSRVGRGHNGGIVTTLFRPNRARDRSHFETFRSYHEAIYSNVEPTSVTPWSLASRDRSLAGALVALIRHSFPSLAANDSAGAFDLDEEGLASPLERVIQRFLDLVHRSERPEAEETKDQIWRILRDWDYRARTAREAGGTLCYEHRRQGDTALLRRFDEPSSGWLVADSMRSVEPSVAVRVREPQEG